MGIDRKRIKGELLDAEHRDFRFPDHQIGVCAWCGLPGGETMPPGLTMVEKTAFEALDMHEWYYKRSSNVPDGVKYARINVVLLHHSCHLDHGQSKVMTDKIKKWKEGIGYDVDAWVDDLLERGVVKHKE